MLNDDEIRELWTGLDAQPGAASDAVRLRLLLGQRGGETAGMVWTEIDLEQKIWTLPAPRTKNRKTAYRAVTDDRPYSCSSVAENRYPTTNRACFPASTLTDKDSKALAPIHSGAYQWKDLRRTVGTRLAESGIRRNDARPCPESRAL